MNYIRKPYLVPAILVCKVSLKTRLQVGSEPPYEDTMDANFSNVYGDFNTEAAKSRSIW